MKIISKISNHFDIGLFIFFLFVSLIGCSGSSSGSSSSSSSSNSSGSSGSSNSYLYVRNYSNYQSSNQGLQESNRSDLAITLKKIYYISTKNTHYTIWSDSKSVNIGPSDTDKPTLPSGRHYLKFTGTNYEGTKYYYSTTVNIQGQTINLFAENFEKGSGENTPYDDGL